MTNLSTKLFSQELFKKSFNLLIIFTFFLLIGILISFLLASPKESEAVGSTVNASAGSSVYYASISNDDTVTIPITPTSTQTEYTATNDITFSSTCTAGSYVYISTSSSSNNALTRTGSDSGIKTINAVAGSSGLTDNTWGFKVNGKAFSQVPVSSSPAVLYTSTKAETNTEINVVYGVKTDNTMPSGTYSNDVVYTVAVKPECLAYTLKFNTDGGSSISDVSVNYGNTVNLNNYTTTKSGYIFGGWTNGTNDFTGTETTANPNPDNNFTVTLSACWVKNSAYEYSYTGSAQTVEHPCNGYYKVELWGASGGKGKWNTTSAYNADGGKSAYVAGTTYISKDNSLYAYIGSAGGDGDSTYKSTAAAGYNGGGTGGYDSTNDSGGGGGGATDIRATSGLWNDAGSLRSRIIVASGGGGGQGTSFTDSDLADAVRAGGLSVTGRIASHQTIYNVTVNQTSGYAFGIGKNGGSTATSSTVVWHSGAGGGGGWYGGYHDAFYSTTGDASYYGKTDFGRASGGSSYISGHTGAVAVTSTSSSSPKSGCTTGTTNNACSISPYGYTFTNTLMIDGAGYKWTTSKQSLQQMPNPSGGYYASGVGHSGNGYAKITYLGTTI
ncbi:MAG: glycine-rich protein [Candidatus Saccharibacteria bacterium]|nr:glycine-rich protein [Candidatus Saccharibacteria bacterium]